MVCFNGNNDSVAAKNIYHLWLMKYAGTNRISGSSVIDKKQSIVDAFRDDAEILIATEAGAEGINLQFCSLVVNYDMPWNPQRIEQRIGRCHRYGQKNITVKSSVCQPSPATPVRRSMASQCSTAGYLRRCSLPSGVAIILRRTMLAM